MQKVHRFLFFMILVVTLLCLAANGMAGGFKKYEDFEGLTPGVFQDDDKFMLSSGCQEVAAVTIEDYDGSQQAKFTYNGPLVVPPALPPTDTSCWLSFNKCPERIVGIKADVTVVSCAADQDCRARFGWHRGINSDDEYLWEQVAVRPYRENIGFGVSPLDQNDNHAWLGDMFWGTLGYPLQTINQTFTMTALFDKPDAVTVTVEGLGTTTYKLDKKMGSPIDIFKGIGIRVGSGGLVTDGVFEAYFDNVAVKTKGACDTKKPLAKTITPKKNLALDACSVDITFNEPMNTSDFDLDFDSMIFSGTSYSFTWSNDRKTFTITRTPCDPLPANTPIKFTINPDGTNGKGYFMDLKGNPAKTVKLTTKTVK